MNLMGGFKMALFDKLKGVAETATKKMAETAEVAKTAYAEAAKESAEKKAAKAAEQAEKKAAEEAYRAEMQNKADENKSRIIDAVEANYSDDLEGIFNGKTRDEVFKYAKNFFEKILLPANSKNKTCISMYPHISKKAFDKFHSTFNATVSLEDCLVYLKDNNGDEFLLTYGNFYFKIPLADDKKFATVGSIPTSKVSRLEFSKDVEGRSYNFTCDDVQIADLDLYSAKESDFITLNNFFANIKDSNFEITNEYIDKIIREKIGFEACTELSNEMDENELILFFTWNSSGGYVACTTEQIIWADKTSGGNVSNINRFYYDEIVKIETVQEASNLASSSATSLTGFLVDMAVSTVADAAIDSFMKDVCDIKLLVQGSYKTMSGMVKLEADRIIAIYNGFKKNIRAEEKELKKQSASPQVVVQQQSQPDVLEQIKKLASLKEAGILSEEEFTSKKTELLSKL